MVNSFYVAINGFLLLPARKIHVIRAKDSQNMINRHSEGSSSFSAVEERERVRAREDYFNLNTTLSRNINRRIMMGTLE